LSLLSLFLGFSLFSGFLLGSALGLFLLGEFWRLELGLLLVGHLGPVCRDLGIPLPFLLLDSASLFLLLLVMGRVDEEVSGSLLLLWLRRTNTVLLPLFLRVDIRPLLLDKGVAGFAVELLAQELLLLLADLDSVGDVATGSLLAPMIRDVVSDFGLLRLRLLLLLLDRLRRSLASGSRSGLGGSLLDLLGRHRWV